ncbi:MAG TPA: S8 family serine peptidase [Allosphingosinicella sp.]|nr:S8 family serine peptidase [Allosphingosinicella sp.]
MAATSRLLIYVVDSDKRPIERASVSLDDGKRPRRVDVKEGVAEASAPTGGEVAVEAAADGFEPERLAVRVSGSVQQIVIGLRRRGERSYDQGDSRFAFRPDEKNYLLFVDGDSAGQRLERLLARQEGKVRIEQPPRQPGEAASGTILVRAALAAREVDALAAQVRKAGLRVQMARPLDHKGQPPAGLTNELVVRFRPDVDAKAVRRIAKEHGFEIEREVRHAGNAYLLVRSGPPEYELLDAARKLAELPETVYVEPNLAFVPVADQYTPNDVLWTSLPYLPLVNADDAWDRLDDVNVNLRGGSSSITIGVVDLNGIAPNHPELTANLTDGTGKTVANWNFAASPIALQTVAGLSGDHGTQCAGSATAAFDDGRGICGVAPNCHLVAARIGSSNAVAMADLYLWMAGFMNGSTATGFPAAPPSRPADVISSSWGSNGLALSNTIRDCFDFITSFGRTGRGCVLCFSLGNTGYIDFTNAAGALHRAWPTYERTIAVGASISTNPTNPTSSFHADPTGATAGIATQVDRRALYSPYGATALRKPDLVSPSHTTYASGTGTVIDPILSAVRVGTGAVNGCNPGTCNDYATAFGGTSHSTPTVAGAIALILSARPDLNWVEVRDILRRTCARIDSANADAIGQWQDLDGDMAIDYSRWYGAGRLDVDAAVQRALDPAIPYADCYVRENLTDIGDVPSPGWHAHSPDIWVRKADDPIPALAWGSNPPHENPERGQDNHVFCRTRNRGTVAAPTVYLRVSITHYPGFEFRYPQEFQPTAPIGSVPALPMQPGTYPIGQVRIDNLAPGVDQIVKMIWPEALIPPVSVTVGSSTVNWHPCLLLEVSPHDGPGIDTSVIAVRGSNNLAQRNIAIDDLEADSDSHWHGIVAGSFDLRGVRGLVIDGSRLKGERRVRLGLLDKRAMKSLAAAAANFDDSPRDTHQPAPQDYDEGGEIELIERNQIHIRQSDGCGLLVDLAPGSLIRPYCAPAPKPPRLSVHGDGEEAYVEVHGLAGRIELPLALASGELVVLRAAMAAGTTGELRLTQRRADGQVSAGYSIVR